MAAVRSIKVESFQKHKAEKDKRMYVGKPEKTIYETLATLRVPLENIIISTRK